MKNFVNNFFAQVGLYIAITFTLLQFCGIIVNSIPSETVFVGLCIVPLRFIYLNRLRDASKNFARIYLWSGWDLSMIVCPTLLYDSYIGILHKRLDGSEIALANADVSFTIFIGVFSLFLLFISSIWWRNDKIPDTDYVPNISRSKVIFWTIALSSVSLVCMTISNIMGLGRLGEQSIYLPYKMTGVVNYFSFGFTWFLNFFILDSFSKKRIPIVFAIGIIILLTFNASLASLSKGQLISPIAGIIIYLIITKKFTVGFSLVMTLLFISVFIAASFLSAYRDSLQSIYSKGFGGEGANYSIMNFTHRIFSDGMTFMKFHATASQHDLNELLKNWDYNVSDVHTYAIDGKSLATTSMHSSGCVNLPAAYLFGYPFFVIFTILASLVVSYIDYGLPRSDTIFSSTIFRVYAAYAIARVYIAVNILEIFTRAYNGAFAFILFPIITIMMYTIYLKFFCVKKINNGI